MFQISQERLKELLTYDPDTGKWTWNQDMKNGQIRKGDFAGSSNDDWYNRIWIDGKRYQCSRLAWLYMTGENPDEEIDHIDRNKSNNKWSNLRLASKKQNLCNKGVYKNNTSGHKGVSWIETKRKWQSQIQVNNKKIHLGYFDNLLEAVEVRQNAALKHHGEFSNG